MNSAPMEPQPSTSQSRGDDRFVLHRNEIEQERNRWNCDDLNDKFEAKDQDEKKKKLNYARRIWEVLGLEKRKIFYVNKKQGLYWPCTPRKKPFLAPICAVPEQDTNKLFVYQRLADWGKDHTLVSVLGNKYQLYNWDEQRLISEGFTMLPIECCKFNPSGEFLLFGSQACTAEIHNLTSHLEFKAHCSQKGVHYCSITSVDWSPTGNSFVLGCSLGTISMYTRKGYFICSRQVIKKAVSFARVSPNARYIAIASTNPGAVELLEWPSLSTLSNMTWIDWKVKALNWHPWESGLLCVALVTDTKQAHLSFWHASTRKVNECTLTQRPYSLDTMLFSENTGELVVSVRNTEIEVVAEPTSNLVVLSDPSKVVDKWDKSFDMHDRVKMMTLNRDGTKLATISKNLGNLMVWNFLPENKRKNRGSGSFYVLPVYQDQAAFGYSIR